MKIAPSPVFARIAATVAGIAVAATVAGCADRGGSVATPTPAGSQAVTVSPPIRDTLARHRQLATAASARAVGAMPLPPGAHRLRDKPAGWPDGGTSIGPSDGRLSRTRWWSTSASMTTVTDYLRDHAPAGMRHPRDSDVVSDGPDRMITTEYEVVRPVDPAAYVGPTLLLELARVGDRTVIHGTTFLAVRTVVAPQARIDSRVTSIRIERSGYRDRSGRLRRLAPVTLASSVPGDDDQIRRLVLAFDGLPGSITPASFGWMSCPGVWAPVPRIRVTFHTEDGHTVVAALREECWGQLRVRVDGVKVAGTLDPAGWRRLVDRAADFRTERRGPTQPAG